MKDFSKNLGKSSFVFRLNNIITAPHITINPQQIEYILLVEDDLAVAIHMVSGTDISFRVISNTTFTNKDLDKIMDVLIDMELKLLVAVEDLQPRVVHNQD